MKKGKEYTRRKACYKGKPCEERMVECAKNERGEMC